MLQKFGLIKYNKNFTLVEDNNKRIFSHNSLTNRNWNSQIKEKRKNLSCKSAKYNSKKNKITKEDIVLQNEINQFINEATKYKKINIDIANLVKINHKIDDEIIKNNNLKRKIYTSRNKVNTNYFKFNDYNLYNSTNKNLRSNKNKSKSVYSKINFIHNLNMDNNIKNEIIDKKILIKNLEIRKEILENKINLLKNEYNKNLLDNTNTNKNYNNSLYNLKFMKSNNKNNNTDLLSINNNINEIINQIFINRKEERIIKLILFKENMDFELNKEDINKMNKLIEIINKDIESKKNQIVEIYNKSKMLLSLINLNIIPNYKKK